MQLKNQISKRILVSLLTLALFVSGIVISPTKAIAAGWLEYANQTITLGSSTSASMKDGDYYGLPESGSYEYYWHIYKFTMPEKGLLNIYLESLSEAYLRYRSLYDGFAIFLASDPDNVVWLSGYGQNHISKNYSASRAMYYGSAEIALELGEYYFAVRQRYTNNTPYYLTLSYKEPTINVSSISLNPSKITMGTGTQQTIEATVLPNNATDKALTWKSANPSIATVDNNGTVTAVTAGTTSIIASSSDGEITATCAVTVTCPHEYQTNFSPATKNNNGYFTEKCNKCGNIRQDRTIYAVSNIALSKKTAIYNGKVQMPSVIVQDTRGKTLTYNTDYTLSFTGNMRDVGKHIVNIAFKGDYKGTASKTFTIRPQSTIITKIKPKRKGFIINWKKQAAQISGYELAYSTNSSFRGSETNLVTVSKNKAKKTVGRLKKGNRYYVRIRTYKNITVNGQTTTLYSVWSKVKSVTTRR